MANWDEIEGREVPDISDLIEGVENAGESLEDFLAKRGKSEPVEPTKHESLPDPRIAAVNAPGYRDSGFARNLQDSHAEGEVPEPVITELDTPTIVPAQAPEPITELEIRNHPIVGSYITETQVMVVGTDPWYAEVFINSKNMGVSDMSPEDILDRIRMNDEAVRKYKAQNQGLRAALEEHLTKMNASDRAKLLERDRSFKPKKVVSEGDKKKATVSKARQVNQLKSAMSKSLKTFKDSLGMSKAEIIKEVEDRGKMTPEVMADIESLFSAI